MWTKDRIVYALLGVLFVAGVVQAIRPRPIPTLEELASRQPAQPKEQVEKKSLKKQSKKVESKRQTDNTKLAIDIYKAIENREVDTVRTYFESGKKCDSHLMMGVAMGNPQTDIVSLLIQNGCDAKNSSYLAAAIMKRNKEVMQLLMNAGADFQAASGIVVHGAVQRMDPVEIRYLADIGANLDTKNSMYETPLMYIISKFPKAETWPEGIAIAKALIQGGCDVDLGKGPRSSPLVEAVAKNNPELVQLLIEAGADLEKTDDLGRTALQMAGDYKFREVVAVFNEARYQRAIGQAKSPRYENAWANGIVAKIDVLKRSESSIEKQISLNPNSSSSAELRLKLNELKQEVEALKKRLSSWEKYNKRGGYYEEEASDFTGNPLDLDAIPLEVAIRNIQDARRARQQHDYLKEETTLLNEELSDLATEKSILSELAVLERNFKLEKDRGYKPSTEKYESKRKKKEDKYAEVNARRKSRSARIARLIRLYS